MMEWKRMAFFGDSIVEGVTTDYARTTETWCELVSREFGIEYDNYGRGGACYTKGYNSEIPTVKETLISVKSNEYDVFFIAAGINDWIFGAPISKLCDALDDTYTYIHNNFIGDVFLITPIMPSIHWRIKKHGIGQYEDLIFQKGKQYSFNIIRGKTFSWGLCNTNSKKVLWDGIHPTEYGYKLYAQNIISALKDLRRNE